LYQYNNTMPQKKGQEQKPTPVTQARILTLTFSLVPSLIFPNPVRPHQAGIQVFPHIVNGIIVIRCIIIGRIIVFVGIVVIVVRTSQKNQSGKKDEKKKPKDQMCFHFNRLFTRLSLTVSAMFF